MDDESPARNRADADRAFPLAADPAADRAELAPVVDELSDAAVVGLGLATHGTAACFAVTDRLLRALVDRGDVRTLAVETDPAAAGPLDDYVARGEGEATEALAALDDWKWSTESVADALRWLRGFNEGRPPEDRVRVRGVDVVSPASGARRLRTVLDDVDPETLEGVRSTLTELADGEVAMDVDAIPRARVAAAADVASEIRGRVDEAADGADRVAHLCRALERSHEWYDAVADLPERPHPDGMAVRDRVMAENARDLARDGAGVALWAHAGHVQRGRFDDGTIWADAETMGERLDESLGADYRAVGTDTLGGDVRALDPHADADRRDRAFELHDLSETTLAGDVDPETAAVLDLGAADDDRRLRTRYVGSVYDPEADPRTYVLETAPSAFDAVVCLGETRASQPVG
jgi:erythromycin esterase